MAGIDQQGQRESNPKIDESNQIEISLLGADRRVSAEMTHLHDILVRPASSKWYCICRCQLY